MRYSCRCEDRTRTTTQKASTKRPRLSAVRFRAMYFSRQLVVALAALPWVTGVLMSPRVRAPTVRTVTKPVSPPARSNIESPYLTGSERLRLTRDGEIQRKDRKGRGGECLHVVETSLSAEECWSAIQDVSNWSELMRGIKSSTVHERRRDGCLRASFTVTKFRLPAALLIKEDRCTVDPDRCVMHFELDPESPSIAVQRCSGRWVVERVKGGLTRISLVANIKATRIVPNTVIDFVAARALDRATGWIPRRGELPA